MTRIARCLLPLLAAGLLAACGFHLRDAFRLPPDLGPVQVVARDPDGPLKAALELALQRNGTVVAEDGATGTATLDIVGERWGNLPISVDERGRAQEFTLRYAVIFNLKRADGTELVPQQAIELARDYVSVPTRAAGADSERDLLSREMRRDMVSAILRRIDAVSRMPNAATPPSDGQPELPQEPVPGAATPATP